MEQAMFHLSTLKTAFFLCLLTSSSTSSSTKIKSSGVHYLIQSEASSGSNPARSLRQRRNIPTPEEVSNGVQVRQFHMDSTLYSRFATVTIDSEVVNSKEGESQEVSFRVQVPEVAFMSNFTMVVDGKKYLGQVLEKAEAEERYQEARRQNQTAGQVKQEPVALERGMDLFSININVAPLGAAHLTLVYNELLERRRGVYRQTLVVQPGSVVDNLTVSASFAEPEGFSYFAYNLPGAESQLTASSTPNKTELTASMGSRKLIFRPTVEMQQQFDTQKGIHGKFTIFYKVNNDPAGGRILVQNDYFAHFFAPANLPALPKNILFIVDISGSMSGNKIAQARDAMLKILDDLKTRASDKFNILLFDDKVEKWRETSSSTLGSEIEKAKGFVREKLESRGGTDINQALMTGLATLLGTKSSRSCDMADMIIFLTDGDPTSGETNTGTIIREVTKRNSGKASLFCLGFGFNLNLNFLQSISDRNGGFVRRIYEEGDAADQLRNFYDELSTPVLCDVEARYSANMVDTDLLTLQSFPLFFEGREIIVAGKTRVSGSVDLSALDAQLQGTGAEGALDFIVPTSNVQTIQHSEVDNLLTEKLWAYMKIKNLLKVYNSAESEADRNDAHALALNMSLTYGFVTPLTSFSIVVESRDQHPMQEDSGMYARGGNQKTFGHMASTGCSFSRSWVMIILLLIGCCFYH